MTVLRRALAVPPFAADPADIIGLGVAAERAGFEGFFLWDHLVFADTGAGPPILDPWQILAVVATRTSRMRLGTMITPVPRRRPWQLAKETVTLDRLSGGRVILGVGLGSPPYADFGIFHEPTADRERAARLDEGLEVLAGLWTGERFSYQGTHFTLDPVRFSPVPVQQPRIPVWVGGVLPAAGPVRRACRWDGMVPLRRSESPDGKVDAGRAHPRGHRRGPEPGLVVPGHAGALRPGGVGGPGAGARGRGPGGTGLRRGRCHLVDRECPPGTRLAGRGRQPGQPGAMTGGRPVPARRPPRPPPPSARPGPAPRVRAAAAAPGS